MTGNEAGTSKSMSISKWKSSMTKTTEKTKIKDKQTSQNPSITEEAKQQ